MRDYANPLLLLVVVVLLACHVGGLCGSDACHVWVLSLCATAFIVDAALAVARAVTHRRALMSVVWSVVFLIVGSCAWVMGSTSAADDEELIAYQELKQAYSQGANPFAVDAHGDCLFTVAASVGRESVVKELLQAGNVAPELLAEAGRRAAENGRAGVLQVLLAAGLPVDAAVGHTTLLCAAAQNARLNTINQLLTLGADPNLADAEGTTPLMYAVQADNASAVNRLLQAGADVNRVDADGRAAASYARSSNVSRLFE